jgi:aryl-alcohol dehydrogenase-like predicted oxidoreductase
MDDALAKRSLGRTNIRITAIGLGCWQFSQRENLSGMFWPSLDQATTREIVRVSLEGGINWFDTAEVYGWGRSEATLADALRTAGQRPGDVVVATKWWPSFRGATSLYENTDDRQAHLAEFPIDLHQIHHPLAFATTRGQMHTMAALVRAGKIRAVGVSNWGARRMVRADAALRELGLGLASNQVKYNLLDRRAERSGGVIEAAKRIGATVIAYSPLEQGLLTGKFHDRPELIRSRQGFRRYFPWFKRERILESRPLIDALREVGARHGGATAAQVALAWLVSFHGPTVVAIPGATKVGHARDNVGALRVTLDDEELQRIDALSRRYARL